MPEDTVFDSTDKGTLRPDEDPLRTKGDAFKPMQLPNWDLEIILPENVSPDDPIIIPTQKPKKKKFSPQRHIILILLIRNSIFDCTNRFPFSEFKNN
jgi:hypothetical protein